MEVEATDNAATEMAANITIEDGWGGDIASSATAHLAHPTLSYFQSSALHEYTNL
ncbi:MAG: hypothetical protein ACI8XX_001172 [Polaribacter sp.]|jgi:hypothetical protein